MSTPGYGTKKLKTYVHIKTSTWILMEALLLESQQAQITPNVYRRLENNCAISVQ